MGVFRRRKSRRAAKGLSIKSDRAPCWWDAHTTQDPIMFVQQACGITTPATIVPITRRTRSVAVATGQETSARTFRSCGMSAMVEMRSIPCQAESARSLRHRMPIVKMNLWNWSTETGLSLSFATSRPCDVFSKWTNDSSSCYCVSIMKRYDV